MKIKLLAVTTSIIGIMAFVNGCSTTTSYSGPHTINQGDKAVTELEPGQNIISLIDGSEIKGEIVSQDRNKIQVKTKYTTMTIDKKNIKEIKYK